MLMERCWNVNTSHLADISLLFLFGDKFSNVQSLKKTKVNVENVFLYIKTTTPVCFRGENDFISKLPLGANRR